MSQLRGKIMRELMLFRHAKSSWNVDGIDDRQRPLAQRGRRDAPLMAKEIRSRSLMPAQIICSDAVRTQQTVSLMAAEWEAPPPVIIEPQIYEASPMAIIACLGRMDDDATRVMIVGHNPGLQELALYILQQTDDPRIETLAAKLPTGSLIVIGLESGTWASVAGIQARLLHFIRPRDLEEN